ncbi:hypothetical protein QTO08_14100 [Vibrio parahaemolyticus]
MKNKLALVCTTLLVSTLAHSAEHRVKDNKNKLADDPTKVITKFGASYANNYDFDDQNISFSGSLALDQARISGLSQQASKFSQWQAIRTTLVMFLFVTVQKVATVASLTLRALQVQRMASI